MKPTLEEIKDNYERVLLRLSNGELAGIVHDIRCVELQVVRKTNWKSPVKMYTIDLSDGYERKSCLCEYDIDAIAFMSNKSLVNDAIVYGCNEAVDWDWDINNPDNLKFKKDDLEFCVEDPSIIKLRQMDEYIDKCFAQAVVSIDTTNTFNIKGENKTMNNILDIYGDRKREKINKHYEQLMELTKLADERYAIFKDCANKLDALYKEDGVITNYLVEPQLSEKTKKHLAKLVELREEEYCKLENLMREVYAQLSMCETYEQKQNVLNTYKILKANGKVNA